MSKESGMKYFTREWQRGDLSEDDLARVSEAYDERLAAIAGSLPPGLRAFAENRGPLNGVLRRAVAERDLDFLILEMIVDDPEYGQCDMEISYLGLRWDWIDMGALARRARDPETRILCHEVDFISPTEFEHSFLFAPRDHVTIRFSDVAISRVAVGERTVEEEGFPFLEGENATLQ